MFSQSFLDFYPAVTLDKDLEVYKYDLRETIAVSSSQIFSIHAKTTWVENNPKFDENQEAKINKLVTIIGHYKDIFITSYPLVLLIKEVDGCDELLNDEAFMNVLAYGIKMSVVSYKASVTYTQMLAEIAQDTQVSFTQISKVISATEEIEKLSSKFHTNVEMYLYFFLDNDIQDAKSLTTEVEYGRSRHTHLKDVLTDLIKGKEIPVSAPGGEKPSNFGTMEEEKVYSTSQTQMESQMFMNRGEINT